ncbi:hypothetical protein [Acinetobacter beijerinckii]|uniref:hypothetical protein n=1 Tax=Acinetobacter beijerinckii TaxID=262668 RepID=UPI003AF704B8
MELSGLKFLITHPTIQLIMGSTVVAYELACYLKENNAEVFVFTHFVDRPMSDFFKNKGIDIISEEDDPRLLLNSFDYIWIHSQILPIVLIERINQFSGGFRFIFNHMSAIDNIADEFPYIVGFEERISSLSLFVSEEVHDKVSSFYKNKPRWGFFRNPVPMSFLKNIHYKSRELRKILIVSNHPPKEILEVKNKLKEMGYSVDTLGEAQDFYELISTELIEDYDLVITIGKTVQYCLVLGVPVFIYDCYGGYGFLNKENYNFALNYNFSGRYGQKMSSDEIMNNILSNFNQANLYYKNNFEKFKEEFSIENNFNKIFENIQIKEIMKIESECINSYIACQKFSRRFFETWGRAVQYESVIKQIGRVVDIKQNALISFGQSRFLKLLVKVLSLLRKIKIFIINSYKG